MIYTKFKVEDIKLKLRENLNNERYLHSVGVMEMSVELAKRFNLDVEKAQIAGLLHDCAKCLSKGEMQQYSYCLEDCEKNSAKTWHAPIGALIAKKDYGVIDDEILSAIRWHTVGKIDMTDFEKIIFIADKIEHRTREDFMRDKIENALNLRNNLNDAMLESFKITIKSLVERDLPICYQTIAVYNSFLVR